MEKIARFRFLSHKFIDTSIKIDPSRDLIDEMQIHLESKPTEIPESNNMRLDLKTCISDSDKIVDINVTVSAMFEYDQPISQSDKENFFKYNAPAIVFPFVRAYINSLTALSGIKPIVLPTINFSPSK